MPGCTVREGASPQFKVLLNRWRKQYPGIDEDLKQAFQAIAVNLHARKARRVQAGGSVVVYKYRQNSRDIKRGERYGWRIYALYDEISAVLYPIIVYPKPAWENADTDTIREAVREIRTILGYCVNAACNGRRQQIDPIEKREESGTHSIKTRCDKCGAVHWEPEVT